MIIKTTGNLDRITDGKFATIMEVDADKQFVKPMEAIPSGAKEGDWLDIQLDTETEEIEIIGINQELTARTKERIVNKMDKLKQRKGSKFKK